MARFNGSLLALMVWAGLDEGRAAAQAPLPAPQLEALPIERPIVVDGVLDDEAWSRAAKGSGFRQRLPRELEPALFDTEIQIAYDTQTLFIAIQAVDAEPDRIVAKEMGRDVELWRDDSLFLLLDTFHDRRNAYVFETNPNSSRTDGLVTDEGRVWSTDWDGVWSVKSRINAKGWSAEFAIPFSTLRFDPAKDIWGFQVRRTLRRANELSFWSPIGRDAHVFRMSRAGEIHGLQGMEQGRALRVKPYAAAAARESSAGPLARASQTSGSDDGEEDFNGGLDVKWGVTRGMSLDLTVNTDFAETEVDEQQINLNRFSLFFPERREFFLENAGIFEFGPQLDTDDTLFKAFFSRRIGIASGGRPTDLELGLRLAGRQGPWSVGVLGARTAGLDSDDVFGGVPETDWGVVRLKRNLGERSNLGMLVTSRDDEFGDSNRFFGFDGDWKPTESLSFWGYGAGTSGSESDDDWSGGFGAEYSDAKWSWSAGALHLGDDFDPQSGFLLRTGRVYSGRVEYNPQSSRRGINDTSSVLRSAIYTFEDGTLETIDAVFQPIGISFTTGDYIEIFTQYRFEEIVDAFELAPGVPVLVGDYSWNDLGVFFETSSSRPVSLRGWAVGGDFFDGKRFSHEVSLNWRPSRFLRTRTTWNRADIELGSGQFVAEVLRQRFDVSLSPDLGISAFFQRNDLAELASLNLRFNWHYRPGSDLFVVLNQTWDSPSFSTLDDRDRQVIVKMTYAWDS